MCNEQLSQREGDKEIKNKQRRDEFVKFRSFVKEGLGELEMKIYNKIELKERRKQLRKNQTPSEKKLWIYLRNKQFLTLKFFRQYSIDYYIADFFCPKIILVIELDGSQHFTNYFKDYDKVRTEIFQSLGIYVIRFSNLDVMNNIEKVLGEIKKFVQTLPDPLFEKREGD